MRARLAGVARDELERRKRLLGILTFDDLLTRLRLHARRSRDRRVRRRQTARALQDRAGRRVPGHRPDPVGHRPPRVSENSRTAVRRSAPRAHRRPQAGDLRLPWRRRPRLPRRRARRGRPADAGHQLAERSGPHLRAGRDVRRGAALATTRSSTGRSRRSPRIATARLPARRRDAALRIRIVQRTHPAVVVTQQGKASAQSAREHVADDVAADIVRMVSSDAEIEERRAVGRMAAADGRRRATSRCSCARTQASGGQEALRRVGSAGGRQRRRQRVREPTAGRAWRHLLEALERAVVGFGGRGPSPDAVRGLDRRAGGRRHRQEVGGGPARLYGWAGGAEPQRRRDAPRTHRRADRPHRACLGSTLAASAG